MDLDFKVLKNCPFVELVPFVKDELVHFWKSKNGRDEPNLADAWCKSYKNSNLGRVLLAHTSPLRGGMPADNNIIERSNRGDKEMREHKKPTPTIFIEETAKILQGKSRIEMDFYGDLKKKVHSGSFMKNIYKTILSAEDEHACIRVKAKEDLFNAR
jgi:hypothetical protein